METLIVIMGLMFATVLVVSVGDRTNLPWPVLLTLLTAFTLFVPGIPAVNIDPDLILPLFLPPLLWALARRVSWAMIRTQWRIIMLLSILLVLLTVASVAWTALILVPGISIAGAIALGAAIAPPDPVAVEAVSEPAGIPRRIVGTLQTEGLFNDAAALVCFQVAISGLTADSDIHYGWAAVSFFYTAIAAIIVGYISGRIGGWALNLSTDSVTGNALTWVIPFAVYLMAEEIHASGVIAVVIAGIEMTSHVAANASEDRLSGAAFWQTAELLLTGLAFGLIGLTVRTAVETTETRIWSAIMWGLIISAVTVLVRFFWMYLLYRFNVRSGKKNVAPLRLQEVLLVTWCGMRGLVTLALVLSLPAGYLVVFNELPLIAITVLFCTMVVPGLMLPWLVEKLDLEHGPDAFGDAAMDRLLRRANDAAMNVIQDAAEELPPDSMAGIARRFRDFTGIPDDEDVEEYDEALARLRETRRKVRRVRLEAIEAAQAEVMSARLEPGVDPAIVDDVLHQLDRMLLASGENSMLGLRDRR